MAFKKTKRKGFNFFRSYYDVFNELEDDSDKLEFIEALLDRQFLGIKPKGLKGMCRFAWISQVNSIDSQVKGYEDKTGVKLTPTVGGVKRYEIPPTEQVQEKEEEQVKEQYTINNKPFLNSCLKDTQLMETYSMQTKTNLETIEKYLGLYEAHLIKDGLQKETLTQFKKHFNNWLNKQQIVKVISEKEPIRYI